MLFLALLKEGLRRLIADNHAERLAEPLSHSLGTTVLGVLKVLTPLFLDPVEALLFQPVQLCLH